MAAAAVTHSLPPSPPPRRLPRCVNAVARGAAACVGSTRPVGWGNEPGASRRGRHGWHIDGGCGVIYQANRSRGDGRATGTKQATGGLPSFSGDRWAVATPRRSMGVCRPSHPQTRQAYHAALSRAAVAERPAYSTAWEHGLSERLTAHGGPQTLKRPSAPQKGGLSKTGSSLLQHQSHRAIHRRD